MVIKRDFRTVVRTLQGDPIRDNGTDTAILRLGLKLSGENSITLSEAIAVLDKNKVTFQKLFAEEGPEFTIGALCANLLTGINSGADKLEGKDVLERTALAKKLYGAKEPVVVKGKDRELLVKLVTEAVNSQGQGKISVLVAAQAFELLEEHEEDVEPKKDPTPTIPAA